MAGGDKREAILRAAISVFTTATSTPRSPTSLARPVADGTVYLYFKSKEDILHSIFDRSVEDALGAARKQIENVADPKEKLRQIALLHLERGADRDLAVVFQAELRGSTKFMEEFSAAGFAEYLTLIRSTFEEGQRAGIFRTDLNAKVVAKVLRSPRRNGYQLDPLQTPLQIGANGRPGAGHFFERSEDDVNRAVEYGSTSERSGSPSQHCGRTRHPRRHLQPGCSQAQAPDTLNYKSGGRWIPISSDEMLERAKRIAAGCTRLECIVAIASHCFLIAASSGL